MTDYQILKLLYKIKVEYKNSKKALAQLIEGVDQNVRNTKSGESYKANIARYANSIILNAIKIGMPSSTHGSYIAANGKQYVCDGARLLEINQPIVLAKVENIPYDYVELVSRMRDSDSFEINVTSTQELETEIKLFRPQKSKRQRIIFGFGEGLPAVNAEYLLVALKELEQDSTIHVSTLNPRKNPMYIENTLGTLFLHPVYSETASSGYWIAD